MSTSTSPISFTEYYLVSSSLFGYLVGFDDNENPIWGSKEDAEPFFFEHATDYGFYFDDHENPHISLVKTDRTPDFLEPFTYGTRTLMTEQRLSDDLSIVGCDKLGYVSGFNNDDTLAYSVHKDDALILTTGRARAIIQQISNEETPHFRQSIV